MSQLSFDEEDYYFQISGELADDKQFILIIYDISDNKRRNKFAKLLEGYGKRVQKSAFEALLTMQKYNKLIEEIPGYINVKNGEDSVRIYRIIGKGKVISWGNQVEFDEDIILI
jgi:CRISPR-associated protein Cas2